MSRQRVLPGQAGVSQAQLFSANSSGINDSSPNGNGNNYAPPGAPDYPPSGPGSFNGPPPSSGRRPSAAPITNGGGSSYQVGNIVHSGQGGPPRRERNRDTDREDAPPTAMMARQQSSSARKPKTKDVFDVDEDTMLKAYGLTTLQPDVWEDTNSSLEGGGMTSPGLPGSNDKSRSLGARALQGQDEPDPLGLYRGSVLSNVGEINPETKSAIFLQSKAFDPKTFLSTVHPGASPEDLQVGREKLKQSIESRSGALQRLVEENFDRFISIKASSVLVYSEMVQGPLSASGDYGVASLKEGLHAAGKKADDVWNPILEARLKADRLRSTLGIFEKSKFFFTLPGVLDESIKNARFDMALVNYKKGKYLLDSRPGALLGLPAGVTLTPQQSEKHTRVFEKVWGRVEAIMNDLRDTLMSRLKDPRRGLEEIEKTIEILLELDSASDPVWLFFDTQHHHIMQVLRNSSVHTSAKFQGILQNSSGGSDADETPRALDLRRCVLALETSGGDAALERASGNEAFKSLAEVVHNLSEIMLQTLPNLVKVSKGYIDGKYQSKDSSSSGYGKDKKGGRDPGYAAPYSAASSSRRNPAQVKTMINEIVLLYISLISDFFALKQNAPLAAKGSISSNGQQPIDSPSFFVPSQSNALTTGWYLLKILGELNDCTNDIGGLLAGLMTGSEDVTNSLKSFMSGIRRRFLDSICAVWVRDAKIFFRLEEWALDTDDASKTIYLRRMATYQRHVARFAYRSSGGDEERAGHLFVSSATPGNAIALLRRGGARDENVTPELARRIHTAYLDALYAFLDGLVHVAFSEPMALKDDRGFPAAGQAITAMAIAKSRSKGPQLEAEGLKPEDISIQDRDVRILLTVSNLSHFKSDFIGKIADQLSTALKIDMTQDSKTLTNVVGQLDKILFDDYIKGRSSSLGETIHRGVLGDGVDWAKAPKPTEVHPYIYDALLSLVLVHAQVTAIARSLVTRTVGALVEEVAKHALQCFRQIRSFGMGGMLQATLEMEFLHQTLNVHVSPTADSTLQEIYKIISQAYSPGPNEGNAELQKELEQLKLTLTQARRATALQFLCFREKKAQPVPSSNAAHNGNATPPPLIQQHSSSNSVRSR